MATLFCSFCRKRAPLFSTSVSEKIGVSQLPMPRKYEGLFCPLDMDLGIALLRCYTCPMAVIKRALGGRSTVVVLEDTFMQS